MTNENAAPLVAQQKPQTGKEVQTSKPTPIVNHLPPDVKVLQDFIKCQHIPLNELLAVVKTIYPRCDKSLLSKCAHGDETGAKLRDDAMAALTIRFAEISQMASPERRRKKPNRCVCRLTDAVFAALQRLLKQRGQSVQDYLEALILADLQAHAKELKR